MSLRDLIPMFNKPVEPDADGDENPLEGPGARLVNGRFQPIYLMTEGAWNRLQRRNAARQQRKGQKAFNRSQRIKSYQLGTVRQQMKILQGDLEVLAAMERNLTRHIEASQRRNELADKIPSRRQAAVTRRNAQLNFRRAQRFIDGVPRGADLRDGIFEEYALLLPPDYAGKRAGDVQGLVELRA